MRLLGLLVINIFWCQISAKPTKVIVVGAGAAGISAARYLVDHGDFEVTILEGNSRIGGRIWTFGRSEWPDVPIELGAMWLHSGENVNQPVAKFCRDHSIGLQTFDYRSPLVNHKFYRGNQTIPEDQVDRQFPELLKELLRIRKQYESENADDNLIEAIRRKSPDLYAHLNDPVYKYYVLPFVDELFGDEASKLSVRLIDEGKDDYMDMIIPKGYDKFLQKLILGPDPLSKPLSDQIYLGSEVVEINSLHKPNVVHVVTKDNRMVETDAVIVTTSLGVLKAETIKFEPSLTKEHLLAISRIGFGDYGKVVLMFDQIFWPENQDVIVVNSEPPGYPLYFISLKRLYRVNGLIAVITGSNALQTDRLSDEVVVQKVIQSLRDTFGNGVDQSRLLFSMRTQWFRDPLYRGAYSYAAVGMTDEDMFNVRKPLGNRIFFAGEHTMWPEGQAGTVHSAYQSGIRAAKELADHLGVPLSSAPRLLIFNQIITISLVLILLHIAG